MGHNDRAAAAKVALGTSYEQDIEVQSDLDPNLKGTITYSLPTGKELARIAVIQHDLREGRPLDSIDNFSAYLMMIISTLTVVVRRAPDWWYRTEGTGKDAVKIPAPELLLDMRILYDVYGRYVAFRESFPGRNGNAPTSQPASGKESAPSSSEAQSAAV